jgi:hypothetical protein
MLQPEIKIPSVAKLFDAAGKLTDETTRQYIQKFLEAFSAGLRVLVASMVSQHFVTIDASRGGVPFARGQ